MPPRSSRPPSERDARSRLLRLLAAVRPILRGSLVTMSRTCGKPGCKCAQGEKHVSLYLAARWEGRRKMIYVPPDLEERVRVAVEDGAQAEQWIDAMSQAFLAELAKLKHKRPRSGGSP